MKDHYPYQPSSLVNQMREAGTLGEACSYLQKWWNELVFLRRVVNSITDGVEDNHTGEQYKHLKTGGLYTVLGKCRIEATNVPGVLYVRDGDDVVWARPASEFFDGRFERIDA